jgi:hypothetical protein
MASSVGIYGSLSFDELDEWVRTRKTWLTKIRDCNEPRALGQLEEVDELEQWLAHKKEERQFIKTLTEGLDTDLKVSGAEGTSATPSTK